MTHRSLLVRTAVVIFAGAVLALAIPAAASADVPTSVQVTFEPSAPVSGQNVEATAFIDWPTGPPPAGYVTFHVEDTGYTITIPTITDATTHFTTATTSVGEFVGGAHVVDATFVPSIAGFTGNSSKTTVAVQGIVGTHLSLGLPKSITVGGKIDIAASLLLPSILYNPGGTVVIAVGGVTIGSCIPQPGALKNTYGCEVAAAAPTHAGPYSASATFTHSPYFADATGSASGTAVAPAVAAKPVAPASPSPTPAVTATGTATPVAHAATTAVKASPASSTSAASTGSIILVAVLAAALGAGVVLLVLFLRRRSATP